MQTHAQAVLTPPVLQPLCGEAGEGGTSSSAVSLDVHWANVQAYQSSIPRPLYHLTYRGLTDTG